MVKDATAFISLIKQKLILDDTGNAISESHDLLNTGRIEDADGYGKISGVCGDTLEIWLKIENDTITDARFMTDGCISTFLCGSAVTLLAKGEVFGDILKVSPADIIFLLKDIQGVEKHCAILAVSTLYRAVADYILKCGGDLCFEIDH
ncbi:MAG: iron-sulfur cluster assembly scaffold protein [bacterium]